MTVALALATFVSVSFVCPQPRTVFAQAGRNVGGRGAALAKSERPAEITPAIERSISRGLAFLAARQRYDGSYGKSVWENTPTYPSAMTPMVGLVFLANGSTPTRGPYAKQLRKITDYLLKCARTSHTTGLIHDVNAYERRPMYCHAFALTYLAQIFGQEKNKKRREEIRKVLKAGVKLCERSQTELGGWGYEANAWDDEGTLVVTQLQALRACRDAGIYVPKRMIDKGIHYIKLSANPDGSVKYRATSNPYNTRPGVTCASVVALWNAGEYNTEIIRRIARHVHTNIDSEWQSRHHAEYVQYYLTQAKFVLGGDAWKTFYREGSNMLLGEQMSDGSWEGKDGGDIYGTVIALLCLQMPYNRLPVYQR